MIKVWIELELRRSHPYERHDLIDLVGVDRIELEAEHRPIERFRPTRVRADHGLALDRGALDDVAGDVVIPNERQIVDARAVIECQRLQREEHRDEQKRAPVSG